MADSYREHFALPAGQSWFNCSHQGPLPRVAAAEAEEAIRWKLDPRELTTERFSELPRRVKRAAAALIGGSPEQIVLGNGASYGLHLLAGGLPLESGDEVLLMAGDFPSNHLPWLLRRERGVDVKVLEPEDTVLSVDEAAAAITPRTRVLSVSWVHSFSGMVLDIPRIGALCRDKGVRLVVNVSQGLGGRRLRVAEWPVDALVSVGWKWLCGPYATGFCWLREDTLEALRYDQAYWLSAQTADDLAGGQGPSLEAIRAAGARRYDIFGTANFFNFKPWAAALELFAGLDAEAIETHDRTLAERFVAGLDASRYERLGEGRPPQSSIILIRPREGDSAGLLERLKQARITAAHRRGMLRFSFHLYNDAAEVDRALDVLNG
ncbi:hypothetical protein ABI59_10770 [Acidobacteria bacterium Mor1]|nr:hypothetical protein ABI59_10770 [Acidobacteria bacterium Mor1]